MKWLNEIEKSFDEAAKKNIVFDSVHNGTEIHYQIASLYEGSFWDILNLIIDVETRRARIVKIINHVETERENCTLKNALNQLNLFITNADTVDEDIFSQFE